MSEIKFFLFGSPRVEYRGQPVKFPRRKALALVMYLALMDQPQSRDGIASIFWPDLDQERARGALRSTLPALTALLPPDILLVDRMTIALQRDAVWIDVRDFLLLIAQSRTHEHSPDTVCEQCFPLLSRAVSLYQGDLLEGFTLSDSVDYDNWQVVQREWLQLEFAALLKRLAYFCMEQKTFEDGLIFTQRWLSLDSLNEVPRRLLMRLYAATGQRTEALRQYEACVRLLDEELSTPPEEETTRLYEFIKANASTPDKILIAQPVKGALPSLPALIVGREPVLDDLKQRLGLTANGPTQPITVIQGWPGVGKSTTVAALAHDPDVAAGYPDGILWASLGEEPSILNVLKSWADALDVNDDELPQEVADLSAQLTAVLRDKRMLLIVDDVWRPEHALPFKVGGHACALVVTSRFNDVARALTATARDIYKLPVLTPDQALELLRVLAPEAVEQHPDDAQKLVNELEGLPLALQVAGRLLHSEEQFGWGVSDLLAELHEGGNLLTAFAPTDMIDLQQNTPPTVAALLKRSTDSLEPETRDRFACLGFFVPKPATFDLSAMAVAWQVDDPKPTARLLVNRGLLEPVGGGRFQMHALLVMHAQAMLNPASSY